MIASSLRAKATIARFASVCCFKRQFLPEWYMQLFDRSQESSQAIQLSLEIEKSRHEFLPQPHVNWLVNLPNGLKRIPSLEFQLLQRATN
jgi:hypothetical protein